MATKTGERIVTVVGGSGFIGRYVVQRLARAGALVRVAVRRPDSALFLKPLGDVGQITPVQTNIRYPESIARAVDGADQVINLVGILYEGGRQRFDAVQAEGARAIGLAAAAAGVKQLVHVSAIGADPESPSAYGRSKAAGEAGIRAAFPQATILRPSLVFGPEDQFFNRFAAMARSLPVLPIIGAESRFQPVYVGDVADAVMAALSHPEAAGRTYELGGPDVRSFRALMELMLSVIQRKRPILAIPTDIAMLQASLLQLLPVPPLTVDQVKLLKRDNVVSEGMPGLADLGITPTAMEAILPSYLAIYRRGARWAFKLAEKT